MANPYLEVIIAGIIWGSTGVFVKYLGLPPTTIGFFRVAIPTIIILLFSLGKFSFTKRNHTLMLVASTLNAVRIFFYFIGFTFATISNAIIILYTWPIFAVLFSRAILKEKIDRRTAYASLLAFVGVVLVYFTRNLDFTDKEFVGMTAMFIAAAVYALTVVIYKKESKHYTRAETIFYQNIVGALVFLPFLLLHPLPSAGQVGIATIYGALIGIVGYGLFFSALKKIKASTASFLAYTEVVSAIAFGILFFHDAFTWNMVLGGALIIIATVLVR